MIAANGITARFLTSKQYPFPAPRRPRAEALGQDRRHRRGAPLQAAGPPGFQGLGRISPAARNPPTRCDSPTSPWRSSSSWARANTWPSFPASTAPGHFGLAVRDYAHSTAPNRRYPDLITQRLLKAALTDGARPYGQDELEALAKHCTEQEDAADKVERQVEKSTAALLLESRIGDRFDAIVTGASGKGTWVRLLSAPARGGEAGPGFDRLDVGDRVRVELIAIDVERGFIDFRKTRFVRERY